MEQTTLAHISDESYHHILIDVIKQINQSNCHTKTLIKEIEQLRMRLHQTETSLHTSKFEHDQQIMILLVIIRILADSIQKDDAMLGENMVPSTCDIIRSLVLKDVTVPNKQDYPIFADTILKYLWEFVFGSITTKFSTKV